VYKILCNDCDASYVGQIKRRFNTKINEHINNKKVDSSRHSVTENSLFCNHSFYCKNIKILFSKSNYKKLISEILHIKEQVNGINLKKDTESLDV